MLTVVQVDGLSPTSYCFRCKKLFKEGEEIEMLSIDCRHPVYKKKNKKLKADYTKNFKIHAECFP